MQVISSKENEIVKNIKKLNEKKYRDLNNEYIIEGVKLIEEAILEKVKIKKIVICDDCKDGEIIPKSLMFEIARFDCIYVTESVFKTMTTVSNPQGILAVIQGENEENKINYEEDIIVALDGIQDPGNLGTILRTLDSVGLNQVLISNKTVDPYNPKVVRSTMGAIFRVNVIECENLSKTLNEIKKNKYNVVCTSLEAEKSIYEIEYNKKVIVIGNEANGISKEILELADEKVKIPMLGRTESLNASVATGVILYEYVRRKKR